MGDREPEIDVRFEAEHEVVEVRDRPLLMHGNHPVHGPGWTLFYREEEGIADRFIAGDLLDVDDVVTAAQLAPSRRRRGAAPVDVGPAPGFATANQA